MTTRLIAVRGPTAAELADPSSRAGGAEVVFERRDREGRTRLVFASTCYGSYQQWGETRDVLADNVEAVTLWAEGMAAVAALIDESDDDDAPDWDAVTDGIASFDHARAMDGENPVMRDDGEA